MRGGGWWTLLDCLKRCRISEISLNFHPPCGARIEICKHTSIAALLVRRTLQFVSYQNQTKSPLIGAHSLVQGVGFEPTKA